MGEARRKANYREFVASIQKMREDDKAKRSEAAKKAAATRKANKEKWLSDPEVKKTIRENHKIVSTIRTESGIHEYASFSED